MQHDAIRNLYPDAVTIRGKIAFDKDGKVIKVDYTLLPEEITKLKDIEKSKEYKELRRKEYIKQGVTREDWIDLDIDGNTTGKAAFRKKIKAIKELIPKPEQV